MEQRGLLRHLFAQSVISKTDVIFAIESLPAGCYTRKPALRIFPRSNLVIPEEPQYSSFTVRERHTGQPWDLRM